MRQSAKRSINFAITRRITQLHHQGFSSDYLQTSSQQYLCIQDNLSYRQEQVTIKLVDQAYDYLLKHYCYLHTIETDAGDRGLLMLQCICFKQPDMAVAPLTAES